MYDFLLSEEEKALKAEARRFAKEDVPSSLIRDMDGERVQYPKEFLQKAASRNLLGLRFSTMTACRLWEESATRASILWSGFSATRGFK